MGLPVKYRCLYGAQQEGPVCSLLDIDGFTVLLDCGWTDAFDVQLIQPLLDVLPSVDIILLSHPDLQHLGALPYLVGKGGLSPDVPIFGTHPVSVMGTMFLYDAFYAQQSCSDFDLFTLDDVDAAFGRITKLKYMQQCPLPGRGGDISLTPHVAGHMVGGAVWLITVGCEQVLYAVHFNHKRDRHLNGSQLESLASRPALLITDAAAALRGAPQRAARDEQLLSTLLTTLRAGGRVLVPVDTAGRVLEVLLVLETAWQQQRLMYPLVLLSRVGSSTLEFAASQLEHMSDEVNNAFITSRDNPFGLRQVKVSTDVPEALALARGPSVVLAAGTSLDVGLARTLLLQWGRQPENLVLLLQPPKEGTLAYTLAHPPGGQQQELQLTLGTRVPLQGEELEAWEAAQVEQEAADEAAAAGGGGRGGSGGGGGNAPLRASTGTISKLVRNTSGGGGLVQVLPEDPFDDPWGTTTTTPACDSILLDGFVRPPAALHPMFPDEEEGLGQQWSRYGLVDEGLINAIKNAAAARDTADPLQAEAEDELLVEEPPTKVVTSTVTFRCEAKVQVLDFSGVADGRSVRTIITHMAPRQLVLLGGSPAAEAALARDVGVGLGQHQGLVYTPGPGEELQLSLTRSFQVQLQQSLLNALASHSLGPYTLAWCDGALAAVSPLLSQPPPDDTDEAAADRMDDTAAAGMQLALVPAQVATQDADMADGDAGDDDHGMDDHGGIFIGNVKLSEVKQALAAAGVPSEFRAGGVLVCGGVIRVARGEGGQGRLVLEGPLCDTFYQVRDVVYSQYNIC